MRPRTRLRWITALAVAALAVSPPTLEAQTSAMSREAAVYLEAALDTIQAVTMDGDRVPWPVVRDSARAIASGARTPEETYGAIDWALRRANKHSFLQARAVAVRSELIEGRIGYLRVPQRGGAGQTLADSLHQAVNEMRAAACGWIVDVRANGGGNMWPMLAGVGPLLGDSVVGYFGDQGWYYRSGMTGVLHPDGSLDTVSTVSGRHVPDLPPETPVAVLMDSGTGSSGEAITVAFLNRPNTRSFGTATSGYATINRGSRLSDGANMVVTTGTYADRTGARVGERITPDVIVELPSHAWPFPTDRVGARALEWLGEQPGCR